MPSKLGRVEQSSPNAALRRAAGAGLDGEDASRAIIDIAAKHGMIEQCPKDRVPIFTANSRASSSRAMAIVCGHANFRAHAPRVCTHNRAGAETMLPGCASYPLRISGWLSRKHSSGPT